MHGRTRAPTGLFGKLLVLCVACLITASTMPVTASSPDAEARPERRVSQTAGPDTLEPTVDAGDDTIAPVDSEAGKSATNASQSRTEGLSLHLTQALSRSTAGLRVFGLTNGGGGIHLDGRYQHALVVRLKADGSYEIVCVNHVDQAEKIMKRRPAHIDSQPLDK